MEHRRETPEGAAFQFRPIPDLKGGIMPQTRDAKGRWMQSVMAADTLTGDKVVNRQQEDLGTIEHLMIDVEEGPRRLRSSFGSGDSWVWVRNCLPSPGAPSR